MARRDRQTGLGGGVLMFARSDISASVTHLENSQFDERVWVTLGCWCRPPGAGVDTSMNADANRLTVLIQDTSLQIQMVRKV